MSTVGYLADIRCIFDSVGSLKEAGGDCGWRPLDDAPVAGGVMCNGGEDPWERGRTFGPSSSTSGSVSGLPCGKTGCGPFQNTVGTFSMMTEKHINYVTFFYHH